MIRRLRRYLPNIQILKLFTFSTDRNCRRQCVLSPQSAAREMHSWLLASTPGIPEVEFFVPTKDLEWARHSPVESQRPAYLAWMLPGFTAQELKREMDALGGRVTTYELDNERDCDLPGPNIVIR